jgi:hypothetical protein
VQRSASERHHRADAHGDEWAGTRHRMDHTRRQDLNPLREPMHMTAQNVFWRYRQAVRWSAAVKTSSCRWLRRPGRVGVHPSAPRSCRFHRATPLILALPIHPGIFGLIGEEHEPPRSLPAGASRCSRPLGIIEV